MKGEKKDKNQNAPSKSDDRLKELVDDVRLLMRYAIETAQIPKSIDIERIFEIRSKVEQGDEIEAEDFKTLVRSYGVLEKRLGPVSASTLRATGDGGESGISPAESYVNTLWRRTIYNVFLILIFHLVAHYGKQTNTDNINVAMDSILPLLKLIAEFGIPFLYGALGADAYLLRETTKKLHLRQFDDRRIPENRARFVLGTLSGGVIVLFVSHAMVSPAGNDSLFVFDAAAATLGFIAGFSIDFLFGTIERVISAILPKVVQIHSPEDRRQDDELLLKYRRMLDDADDENIELALKDFVEDLELRARK